MNAKEFYIELGNIDDDLIIAAGETPARRKKPVFIYTAVVSAACLCLLIGGIALGISSGNNTPAVSGEDTRQLVTTEGPTFKKTGDTSENNIPTEYSNSVYIISVSPDATEEEISALLNNEGLTVVYSYTEQMFAVSVPRPLNEAEEAEFIKRLEVYRIVLSVEPDPVLTADLGSE